ncbi:hypothetical protein ACFPPD_04940 [Cohnella suwonensis]|uniref:Uncharacterized protein n=1 Tax=Cohnella suwonensis TaxID=696072 RepID=A0ABW0LRX3_9BACL
MLTISKREPVKWPEFRMSDSESMQNKLQYRIRTGNMNDSELNRLQTQCTEELHRLRTELDMLLRELRQNLDPNEDRNHRERIAA